MIKVIYSQVHTHVSTKIGMPEADLASQTKVLDQFRRRKLKYIDLELDVSNIIYEWTQIIGITGLRSRSLSYKFMVWIDEKSDAVIAPDFGSRCIA